MILAAGTSKYVCLYSTDNKVFVPPVASPHTDFVQILLAKYILSRNTQLDGVIEKVPSTLQSIFDVRISVEHEVHDGGRVQRSPRRRTGHRSGSQREVSNPLVFLQASLHTFFRHKKEMSLPGVKRGALVSRKYHKPIW